MNNNKKEEELNLVKSIRFEEEMIKEINKLAKESERDFSAQVRFMCKEYIRLKQS